MTYISQLRTLSDGKPVGIKLCVGHPWEFFFAIGCIQAQACHTGKCPTGVTSQDPQRYKALNVDRKYMRKVNQ